MGSRWWQLLRAMLTSQREVGAQRLSRGHDGRFGVQSGAWKDNDQVSVFCACVWGRETDTVNRAGQQRAKNRFLGNLNFSRPRSLATHKTFTVHEHVDKSKDKSKLGVKKSTLFQSLFFLCLLVQ